MSCSHILWNKYEKLNCSYPSILHAHWTFTIKSMWLRHGGLFQTSFVIQQRDLSCSLWDNKRGGEGTICGGPTLSGGLPSVQATCWKPRGGAQPDSLGSAQLPGAAAPAVSQGLSCCRNTTRNCNRSQSQHPEMLPLAAPFTIRTPPAQAQHRSPHC